MKKKKRIEEQKARLVFIGLISLVLAAVFGNFLLGKLEQKKLENKFSNLDQAFEKVAATTQQEYMVNFKKDKYCRRDQNKFSEGPLYCLIELKTTDQYKESGLLEAIKKSMSQNSFVLEAKHEEILTSGSIFENDIFTHKSIKCGLRSNFNGGSPKDNEIIISCTGLSDRSFYPYRGG